MWKSSSSRSIAKSSHGVGSSGRSTRRSSFYSTSADDYKLLEEIGNGATATVYRAIFLSTNEVVAVKCLNLERCNTNLDNIRREAQTMSLIDHPNLISAYCSFVVEQSLWVVMPFMTEGSCLHLMKVGYPDGFEESVIGSFLKETLKAMEYLHRHGHIHRDIKAGNILLDSSGMVKLGDFGVSACVFDNGDRQRSRNTFVGTPCWMAPEVLQPGSGYDFKADIWSFGITALELAHGHAPFSKYPPMKVLLMTIQNAPPGLDYDRDKRFSRSFKEMVAMCLVKDQRKRPTAEKLLKHSFFKNVKPHELSVKSLLSGLPPLWDRVKDLQLKDAAQLALKQEALSMSEYQRGVSAWKFDIEDLKAQASLIMEDEELSETKENGSSLNVSTSSQHPSNSRSDTVKPIATDDKNFRDNIHASEKVLPDGCENIQNKNDSKPSTSKQGMDNNNWKVQLEKKHPTCSGPTFQSGVRSNSFSGRGRTSDRFDSDNQPVTNRYKHDLCLAQNLSGPMMLPNRASANSLSAPMQSGGYGESIEERSKSNMVQIKGRFSVTSENVDIVKDIQLSPVPKRSCQPPTLLPKESINSSMPASILMPHLQNLLQQTSFQQDLIMNMLNSLQESELGDGHTTGAGVSPQHRAAENGVTEIATTEREQLLCIKIAQLQAGIASLTDDLTTERLKHNQLKEQFNAICHQKGDV